MKRIVLASLLALVGIGTASADYQGESDGYLVNNVYDKDMTQLPATAAGKTGSDHTVDLPAGFVNNDSSRPKI